MKRPIHLIVALALPLLCTANRHHHGPWQAILHNPADGAQFCGRAEEGAEELAFLCDPDRLMSRAAADATDAILEAIAAADPPYPPAPCQPASQQQQQQQQLQGYDVRVALVQQLEVPHEATSYDVVRDFALHLHQQWGVGGPCQTGMLIVVAADNRELFITQGSGVDSRLVPEDMLRAIVQAGQPLLYEARYDALVEQTVLLVGRALAGQLSQYNQPLTPDWSFRFMALFSCWLTLMAIVRTYDVLRDHRRAAPGGPQDDSGLPVVPSEDCRLLVELIRKDQATLQLGDCYDMTSCPICMEDLVWDNDCKNNNKSSKASTCEEATCKAVLAETKSTSTVKSEALQELPAQHSAGCSDGSDETTERQPLLVASPAASAAASTVAAATAAGLLTATSSQLPRRALVVKCGHVFCEACLIQWIEKQRKLSCPVCRQLLPATPQQGAAQAGQVATAAATAAEAAATAEEAPAGETTRAAAGAGAGAHHSIVMTGSRTSNSSSVSAAIAGGASPALPAVVEMQVQGAHVAITLPATPGGQTVAHTASPQ